MRKLIAVILLCSACLDSYSPPASSGNINALVVDGYIDSDGSAWVKLSRSLPLSDQSIPPKETGATVTIESSVGQVFSLNEDSVGLYKASGLVVDYNSKYVLHVVTSDSDYRSGEVKIYPTPAIDSVYWSISDADQLQIKVDSHETDPNATGFYIVNGIETYEYHAPVHSAYKFVNKVAIERTPEEEIYTCYRNVITPNILVTTKGFSTKVMIGVKIDAIDRTSPKISVRYSVLARQRAVSEEEYSFQKQLKASSEQQGSLFAQIPGIVTSNVVCTTNPGEYVLGYFRGQEVKTFRYFIGTYGPNDHSIPVDFKQPPPDPHCEPEQTCIFGAPVLGPRDCVDANVLGDDTIITTVLTQPDRTVIAYFYTRRDCGDCTIQGGVTQKPSFW